MRAEVFGLGSSEESRANIPGRVSTGSYRYEGNWGEEAETVGGGGVSVQKDSFSVCWLRTTDDIEFVRLHWPAKMFSLVRSTLQLSVQPVKETKSSVHQGEAFGAGKN